MSQLIGPGNRCWECGGEYGEHAAKCSISIQAAKDRAVEEQRSRLRDCRHQWEPSGFSLVKTNRNVVITHEGAVEVEACIKCGLLRLHQGAAS